MTRAYNEDYVFGAMERLGCMMDYAENAIGLDAAVFWRYFICSGVADLFGSGHPRYLAGMSGSELARLVVTTVSDLELSDENDGICICPGVNLSTNVGIGVEGGTNYEMNDDDPYSKLGMGQIQWPLKDRTDLTLDKAMLKMDKKEFFRLRMIGLKKKIRNIISGR